MRPHASTPVLRGSWAVLLVILLSATWSQGQSPPNPDVQQLKDKLQQLDQEMQELKAQIGAVEQARASTTASAAVPPSDSSAAQGTPEKPAQAVREEEHKSSLDLYGFVMLDSGYDFGQIDPNWFDVERPTKLPAFANEFGGNGNVYYGVRQTRFGVKTSTPTGLGDLKTWFEFELFGTGVDAGQTTFRLRQA
ncbi:MAG TPA: hypothetical protein VEI01_06235, partial [Terriglobales bacterium]|nr:hypothetical protein [Terriglobales bacterium]